MAISYGVVAMATARPPTTGTRQPWRRGPSRSLVHLDPVPAAICDEDAVLGVDLDAHRASEQALAGDDVGELLAELLHFGIDLDRPDTPLRHHGVSEQRRERRGVTLEHLHAIVAVVGHVDVAHAV